jgi:hypothetical protein
MSTLDPTFVNRRAFAVCSGLSLRFLAEIPADSYGNTKGRISLLWDGDKSFFSLAKYRGKPSFSLAVRSQSKPSPASVLYLVRDRKIGSFLGVQKACRVDRMPVAEIAGMLESAG